MRVLCPVDPLPITLSMVYVLIRYSSSGLGVIFLYCCIRPFALGNRERWWDILKILHNPAVFTVSFVHLLSGLSGRLSFIGFIDI